MVDLFCGQGGAAEGVRRSGGGVHGVDLHDQPNFRRRFGETAFTQADAADASRVRDLRRRTRAFFTSSSPPCKSHSSARMRGEASEEPLIAATRDALEGAGGLYSIENVVGAKAELKSSSCLLRGAFFGERVDRPRFFEPNFEVEHMLAKNPGFLEVHHPVAD